MLGGLIMMSLFLTALFLILLVLVQRGRGGGLAGAFGGLGGQSAFGTKAGDLFTRITMVTATVWIILCAAAVKYFSEGSSTPLAPGLGKSAASAPDTAGGATTVPDSKAGAKAGATGGGETSAAGAADTKSGASATPPAAADAPGDDKAK